MVHWTVHEQDRSEAGAAGLSRSTKRISIPAGKEVCLTFSAKGYGTLVPSDPADPSKPLCLRLQSGEVKSLDVQLEPEAKNVSATR